MDKDRISKIFDNKIIFMTGGTGFMGKVFIERLLRDTNVKKILILIRSKKSKSCEERLKEFFDDPLFNKLKETKSIIQIFAKIHTISGDCSEPFLNISPTDRELIIKNANFIFHFAATVKFTEKFKTAIILNVRGTYEILKLANECQNLSLFCHLSTAFCHMDQKILYEKFYASPVDPFKMIEIAENLNENEVEEKLKSFLSTDIPNSYIFTKALSEALIVKENDKIKLPVVICRPAVVTSTYSNPIAGWTDNLNGPCGLIIAAGSGILRVFHEKKDFGFNSIPVDFSINQLMMSCWNFLENEKINFEPQFVNFQCLEENMLQLYVKYFSATALMLPFSKILWYPRVMKTGNFLTFYLMTTFYHWIPAIFIDFFMLLSGNKPFLFKVHEKISKELKCLQPFLKNRWIFDDTKIKEIVTKLNKSEAEKYGSIKIDGEFYILNFWDGVRKFLMKQDENSIADARKSLKK
ncbi:hypothetical protein PVAND_016709 [Polypedilum vanderplanki]|uniref:Fatty acyl-CoA reductase n=1 Tax=Polypedilum vanderplanki TaxID=319348 RepID=A0A9J6BGS5_POLVA|nr:hypothetical protein PVAND_016709 [Polypedilum vanderplanki]